MLDDDKIVSIATDVATANLSHAHVTSVSSEPTIDSEGHDALRITIVLAPDSATSLSGDKVLDTLLQIRRNLQTAGESRFPIVEFATEAELADAERGDSQS
ncbi:MAG TPA: hypothetical protein VFU97_01350 [Xanthobacteraceae bacterium]|jgi:hypothetical protein|nr:hypothetical protein [Xanthobacteraceae bacterium]